MEARYTYIKLLTTNSPVIKVTMIHDGSGMCLNIISIDVFKAGILIQSIRYGVSI